MPGTTLGKGAVLVASRPEDIKQLQKRSVFSGRIRLQLLVSMDKAQRQMLERRVARHSAACGCNEGAVAGLLYLVVTPILAWNGVVAASTLSDWLKLGGGFLLAALLGKAMGVALGRWQLRRALRDVERILRTEATYARL